MHGRLLMLLCLLVSMFCVGQEQININPATSMNEMFEVLDALQDNDKKRELNNRIEGLVLEVLQDSFSYKPRTERIGKISSSDKLVNIYTWNYQDVGMNYHYSGIIQHRKSTKDTPQLIVLKDQQLNIPLDGFVKPDDWYGALYYDVVVEKHKKTYYYTVLGWDGNDGTIARKVIDNFMIDKKGRVKFGYPLFKIDGKTLSRRVFNFSAQGSMMLVYDPSYKRIVFDHLSPDSPNHNLQYQYYGPDFTYDAFKFQKGKWVFEPNVDVRNKRIR